MKGTRIKLIEGKELSLEEYLEMLLSPTGYLLHPNNQFPTSEMLNQFLETVKDRADREIKSILHAFFLKNATFNLDLIYKETYQNMDLDKFRASTGVNPDFDHTEHFKRLMAYEKPTDTVWEGITWIIDLLPHFPNEALNALNAWYLANCQFLSDSYLTAFEAWTAIIRSKYVDCKVPQDEFLKFNPKEFEFLTAELYERMGYTVELTKASYDGGIDVIAKKGDVGAKEVLVIQCKRKKDGVGIKEIRELLGVVTHNKATKGTLIASCHFTAEAVKFATSNPNIELIDNAQAAQLLNLHLGPMWPIKRDRYFMNQIRKANDDH